MSDEFAGLSSGVPFSAVAGGMAAADVTSAVTATIERIRRGEVLISRPWLRHALTPANSSPTTAITLAENLWSIDLQLRQRLLVELRRQLAEGDQTAARETIRRLHRLLGLRQAELSSYLELAGPATLAETVGELAAEPAEEMSLRRAIRTLPELPGSAILDLTTVTSAARSRRLIVESALRDPMSLRVDDLDTAILSGSLASSMVWKDASSALDALRDETLARAIRRSHARIAEDPLDSILVESDAALLTDDQPVLPAEPIVATEGEEQPGERVRSAAEPPSRGTRGARAAGTRAGGTRSGGGSDQPPGGGEPPGGGPEPPAAVVSRRPDIDFHDKVTAGVRNDLVVRLSDPIRKDVKRIFKVTIPEGAETVVLRVSLSAPGFEVSPDGDRPIHVGRVFDKDRERVTFSLTAKASPSAEPVRREIKATIWLGNDPIGGVAHWTTVVPAGHEGPVVASGKSRSVPFAVTEAERDCELVLRVEGIDNTGSPPYRLTAGTRIPGQPPVESLKMGTLQLNLSEFEETLHQQFAEFAETYPDVPDEDATRRWRKRLLEELDALGKWLWSKLPEELQSLYFRLYDDGHLPASILVHSDEMLIPWELIVPHRSGEVLPKLGDTHVMGRWRPALGLRPRPQRVNIGSAIIANPKYSGDGYLLWSILEAADLKAAFSKVFRSMAKVDRDAMVELLDRDDVQLLHFTGHGEYSRRADLSKLILEGGETLTAMKVIASSLMTKAHPIVYLNACEVGFSGVVLGQMGGFAAQCIDNECSGVIAPYWAVSDASARDFAIAFYNKLAAGRTVGEALLELRNAHPDDPTYQAFSFVGDPHAQPLLA